MFPGAAYNEADIPFEVEEEDASSAFSCVLPSLTWRASIKKNQSKEKEKGRKGGEEHPH